MQGRTSPAGRCSNNHVTPIVANRYVCLAWASVHNILEGASLIRAGVIDSRDVVVCRGPVRKIGGTVYLIPILILSVCQFFVVQFNIKVDFGA